MVQSQNVGDLIKQLDSYSASHLQEKIYVHVDRSDHITGEVLWFKLYVVDGTLHRPLDFSKVAYVEILDKNNEPVLQTKVLLENATGKGSLYLPATLSNGNYSLRAYTNWMKNQGAHFFFQTPIQIINTLKGGEESKRIATPSIQIEVFPEGGQLAAEVKNRVAFKVVDKNGFGVDAKIFVLTSNLDTIARSSTLKFGIGRLEYTPKQGERYTVTALTAGSRKASIQLPVADTNSYAMMLSDSADILKIRILGQFNQTQLALVAHSRQSVRFAAIKKGLNGIATFEVDKTKLSDGISHLTIFNVSNQPICERLYFKQPKTSSLTVQTNQQEYNIRRKASLKIQSSSMETGDYSISIFRSDSLENVSSITSHLLLTSDLAGYIEYPDFYFSNHPVANLAADNLMLTHGWRRFSWNFTQSKDSVAYLPEIRGHLIQGKIVDEKGNGVAGKTGFLASPGRKIKIYTALSKANGVLRFQMNNFLGGKIFAQTDYLRDSLTHVEIENPYFSQFASWKMKDISLTNNLESPLIMRSISMQVQDIYKEDETYFNFAKQEFDSIPFYGKPDETYLLDDYTRFPVMEDVLREYVKGVWVRKNKTNFRFRVIDKVNKTLFKDNPLVLVDGVPVFDINQVMEVDPLKIQRLDVLGRKYYLGPIEFQGIVSYSTYNGDLGGITLDPRSISINYEGLQQQREFYSPTYDSPAVRNSRIPDQRYQLYWNPSVKLESGKETTLDFYTSDVEGKFFVVLEGISRKGSPASGISFFSVSR